MNLKKVIKTIIKQPIVAPIHYLLHIYNKIQNSKVIVIHGENCNDQTEAIFNRIRFFFDSDPIVYKDLRNWNFIYILFGGHKLYFGLKKNPSYFRNEFYFYDIDPCKNTGDATAYHAVLSSMEPFDDDCLKASKAIFDKTVDKLKEKKLLKSYLFGTGSSLGGAIELDWNDGYKIVCNTIVKDKVLWNHINPDIFAGGDPIYHFGDNLFARAFRKDLEDRLSETPETIFVYTSMYHPFAKKYFSKFIDRLVPIPLGNSKNFAINLKDDYVLPNLDNVLNTVLLPLGTTLAKNIYFWGFNGRGPDDEDFWKNSENHFYQNYVYDLKLKHPKFFEQYLPAGDKTKYFEKVHGDAFDDSLTNAEKNGWSFFMMHDTYTKALKKRIIINSENLQNEKIS